ncbi:hypothetical protein HRbin32_00156 [bacterium HR32]|nr:hypothetical protein HRbin32_00156 [bacterium HR32]
MDRAGDGCPRSLDSLRTRRALPIRRGRAPPSRGGGGGRSCQRPPDGGPPRPSARSRRACRAARGRWAGRKCAVGRGFRAIVPAQPATHVGVRRGNAPLPRGEPGGRGEVRLRGGRVPSDADHGHPSRRRRPQVARGRGAAAARPPARRPLATRHEGGPPAGRGSALSPPTVRRPARIPRGRLRRDRPARGRACAAGVRGTLPQPGGAVAGGRVPHPGRRVPVRQPGPGEHSRLHPGGVARPPGPRTSATQRTGLSSRATCGAGWRGKLWPYGTGSSACARTAG